MEDMTFDSRITAEGITIIPQNQVQKEKSKLLGEGKFGKVFLGSYNSQPIVIKKLKFEKLEETTVDDTVTQLKNLKQISEQCPEVPKFFGIWKGKKGKYYNLIFEYVQGEALRHVMKKLSTEEKISIIYQVAETLQFLHSKQLAHRDIKPENIIITTGQKVKMVDFGTALLAKTPGTMVFTKSVVTTHYTAPDIFEEDSEVDDRRVDVWALGVLLTEVLSSVVPYSHITKNTAIIETYLIQKKPFPIPNEIIKNFENILPIIQKCLVVDKTQRCTSSDVVEFLKPFLTNI
jgi:serine/threonine protein kinase